LVLLESVLSLIYVSLKSEEASLEMLGTI
jgi:hypothetical protein